MTRTITLAMAFGFSSISLFSQCPPVVSPNPGLYPPVPQIASLSITDFGAFPNDACSDHDAFKAAAQWINMRGGYTYLKIPHGEFIVGKQGAGLPNGQCVGCFVEYENPFKLVGCVSVTIAGSGFMSNAPKIRFESCLMYGGFTNINGVDHAMVNVNCGNPSVPWPNVAQVGAMLWFESCKGVVVSNLELDGNLDKAIIGGKFNYDGYQLNYDGVMFSSCRKISMTKLDVHHFGRDGMIICSSLTSQMGFYAGDCKFNSNGRLGGSWGGGNGLSFERCDFNLNGTGRISSKPASGFDVEQEYSNPLCSTPTEVFNGSFKSCNFIGNSFCGLITDQPTLPTRDIRLDQCVFQASAQPSSFCSWQKSKAVDFFGCKFYGRVGPCYSDPVTTWPLNQPDHRTKFRSCYFSEEDGVLGYIPNPGANCEYFPNILEIDGIAARVLFERCIIDVNCNGRVWLRGMTNSTCAGLGCPTEANYISMVGCTVTSRGRNFCSQPWPEEPFTFGRIDLQNMPSSVQAPSSVRPPGSGSYYWGPTSIANGSFAYSTFSAPPFDPCLPLYTDPPILVPTVTCGQPAPVPIPFCQDETINLAGLPSKSRTMRATVIGTELLLDRSVCRASEDMTPYRILDGVGRVVSNGSLKAGATSVQIGDLPQGWYYLVTASNECGVKFFKGE